MKIGIIGGAGHVGLPTGLVLADHGHEIVLIDNDEVTLEEIAGGDVPYFEPGAEKILTDSLREGRLKTSTNLEHVNQCESIVIVVGTPIDEHKNPQMDNLLGLIDEIIAQISGGQLLTLRSTVYPGTTAIVRNRLEENGLNIGEDVYLSFAPERIAQHRAMDEITELPQLIGAFDDESDERTRELFDFVNSDCLRLTPTEAELGKLFTNMWRYLTFAAANEFYLIAESFDNQHDVNIHRILEQTSYNYPRFDVPSPGANVGGPCLTKDGWFLVDNIPFNELVSASFQINEGMPANIVSRMSKTAPDPDKIAILGMTFKQNSDDTRNSVSFRLRNHLKRKGMNHLVEIEPNIEGFGNWDELQGSDWVILMTPHDEFSDLVKIQRAVDNEDCLYCDIWGYWDEVKYQSDNGYFWASEVPQDIPQSETQI